MLSHLEVYGDYKLRVNQMAGEYEVKYEALIPYHKVAIELENYFKQFYIDHISCHKNIYVDALAALATTLTLPVGATKSVSIGRREVLYPNSILQINEVYQVGLTLEH